MSCLTGMSRRLALSVPLPCVCSWLQHVAEWKLGDFKLRRAEVHRRRLSLRALLQASKMEARRVVAHRVGTSQRCATMPFMRIVDTA